jgi:hypothetical protein
VLLGPVDGVSLLGGRLGRVHVGEGYDARGNLQATAGGSGQTSNGCPVPCRELLANYLSQLAHEKIARLQRGRASSDTLQRSAREDVIALLHFSRSDRVPARAPPRKMQYTQ